MFTLAVVIIILSLCTITFTAITLDKKKVRICPQCNGVETDCFTYSLKNPSEEICLSCANRELVSLKSEG